MTKALTLGIFQFLGPGGVTGGSWRHPDNTAVNYLDIDHWTGLGKKLDAAGFDFLFFADAYSYPILGDKVIDVAIAEAINFPQADPIVIISAIAEPSGRSSSSSAARAWNSLLYSTTGGHAPGPLPSEPTVAQPLSQIVARTRTARRCLEHSLLGVIGFLHGFELLGQSAGALAGAAQGKQEQQDRECDDAVAEPRAHPCRSGERGEEPTDHRRPRRQSSSRA